MHVRLGLLQHDLGQAARPLLCQHRDRLQEELLLLAWSHSVLPSSGGLSRVFLLGLLCLCPWGHCGLCLSPQITLYSMYVAIMAFNAKVSDPLIGGTYMTLLNTVSNLGGNWPSTVALWLVDPLTVKECVGAQGHTCATAAATEVRMGAGGGLCSMSQLNGFLQYFFCL